MLAGAPAKMVIKPNTGVCSMTMTMTMTATCPQVLAFELVAANGSLVTLTPKTHPFLMKAARISVGKVRGKGSEEGLLVTAKTGKGTGGMPRRVPCTACTGEALVHSIPGRYLAKQH
jgi:hypothetical protein